PLGPPPARRARLGVSLDSQPEESAPPGGSMDRHPAEWPALLRLTVQRSANPPVSVWVTVHPLRAGNPGDHTGRQPRQAIPAVAAAIEKTPCHPSNDPHASAKDLANRTLER